ncbi:hypothetical protein LX87_01021 [Larkinella arboricola]|uniref:Uncharacterized protein n=2 Tax=Larkinella arboricola TaxID=643671 RepID=A0A327X6Y4_LARAB|nr:hypothetical protein LX87_01021 [Larkinella arboricola]
MASKDVVSFIKLFSVVTWEKIAFVRRQKGLKFHEVTATQNLLFQFRLLAEANPSGVIMYEADSEKTNGNDIELYIKINGRYIFFACQAKIVYDKSSARRPDTYDSIKHLINKKTPNPEEQIESLLRYAKRKGGIPIYLFYNYCADQKTVNDIVQSSSENIEVYGCSYVDARSLIGNYYSINDWHTIPTFRSLHIQQAKPFYKLFETMELSDTSINLRDMLRSANLENTDDNLTQYERPFDEDGNNWVSTNEALPRRQKSRKKSQEGTEDAGFAPRYRLVINDLQIDSPLAQWLFL